MDLRLEVVVVPVSDVDRAKEFYAEKMGFNVDVDGGPAPGVRVVQLTPPNSACSITLMEGAGPKMEPGSLQGLQITTRDLKGVREELLRRGAQVSEIQRVDFGTGEFVPVEGEELETFNAFVFLSDPDGNGWAIQQGPT